MERLTKFRRVEFFRFAKIVLKVIIKNPINKLLANVASDFKLKNTMNTLFKDEVPIKMCT